MGMAVANALRARVVGNEAYNNGERGIDADGTGSWADRVVLEGNEIHDHAYGGIDAYYRVEVLQKAV